MSNQSVAPARHRLIVAVAMAVMSSACSLITSGPGGSWRPEHGPPRCRRQSAIVVDLAMVFAGALSYGAMAALRGCGPPGGCPAFISGTAPLLIPGLIGTGIGLAKAKGCNNARETWDEARRTVFADLRRETETVLDVDGDSLVIRAVAPEICHDRAWLGPVGDRAVLLESRGVTTMVCRWGDVDLWSGPVNTR